MRIVLIGPGPVCGHRVANRPGPPTKSRTAENTAQYAAAAKSLALEIGVAYVDLWRGFLGEIGWVEGDERVIGSTEVPCHDGLGRLVPDGLHFSEFGNRICYRLVLGVIREVWPELRAENMEMKVPEWDDENVFQILEGQGH